VEGAWRISTFCARYIPCVQRLRRLHCNIVQRLKPDQKIACLLIGMKMHHVHHLSAVVQSVKEFLKNVYSLPSYDYFLKKLKK